MKFLKKGDVIEIKFGMIIYAMIPEHFCYYNKRGSFKLTHHEVEVNGEFDYFCGEYVVYKTKNEGGGTAMGNHDVFPDGHHVFCRKLEDAKMKIDFYQSGLFTAMIKDIEPIRRLL